MNEKQIEGKNNTKNPYSYNGDVVNLPPHLTPQNKDTETIQNTDNQQLNPQSSTNRKLYIYTYGCQSMLS